MKQLILILIICVAISSSFGKRFHDRSPIKILKFTLFGQNDPSYFRLDDLHTVDLSLLVKTDGYVTVFVRGKTEDSFAWATAFSANWSTLMEIEPEEMKLLDRCLQYEWLDKHGNSLIEFKDKQCVF